VGAAALIGRLVMGGASDRIGRRGALAIALALQTGAFAGFAQSHALPALYANSLVFGLSYGVASTLFPATVADVFGREQAGTRAGDYQLAWWLSAECNGLALLLIMSFPFPRARTANERAVA